MGFDFDFSWSYSKRLPILRSVDTLLTLKAELLYCYLVYSLLSLCYPTGVSINTLKL